jgi:hypothetical protein
MSAGKGSHSNRGAALITVLFLVMAVAVIAYGLFGRTDLSLAAGRNFVLHTQVDALAYSGLECARFLVRDSDLVGGGPAAIEGWDAGFGCEVEIAEPNENLYEVVSRAWFEKDGSRRAESILSGRLYYDPNESVSYYRRIDRQVR